MNEPAPTPPPRTVRGLAGLKRLAIDDQNQIIAWVSGPAGAEGAREWVRAKYELEVSLATLWDFLFWWQLRRHLETAARFAAKVRKTLARLPDYQLDDETLSLATQAAFEVRALQTEDWRALCQLRRLRQKERDYRVNERKLALLERKAAQAEEAAALARSTLTPEERERRLKEIFGLP
jgi:hypothetical protein